MDLVKRREELITGQTGLRTLGIAVLRAAVPETHGSNPTIVGWYFFGEQNVKYLLGLRWVQSYRVLVLCFLMLGSFLHVTLVWELADFFNGIMVIPNVIALLALSGLVAKVLKDYDTKFMLGETPEYGALSPSGGEPFSLEPSPRKGRRFSRLKLRLRRKKTPPVNLDEMDQLKERGLDRF